ncbi:DUF1801 domain-containing protein [Aquimarina sp. U1-2]|uniref:DUF1801 domain-containing protein n=1 Tax=Aquimarina sp. U1-2 TaxID=2823141 RepID=UPI001AECE732|nr:DUF1801 domain-containing protein [Aquimarina sp. U1-2]MBP2831561.1 DUF1801 domain-containing protein [Aquimarina sp. U1-2]
MNKLKIHTRPDVELKFKIYPKAIQSKLNFLRNIIFETAKENADIEAIEETLKWGEPSYLTSKGSTIRIDWKPKTPNQYAIYFKCTSKLVPTFKEVYGDTFTYEKNRAILFTLDDHVPVPELKECIRLALQYHQVKHKPRLGK